MTRLAYETAETLIYDPVSANRAATRSCLYNLGFRKIEVVATLEALEESISKRPPDLALCEAQGSEEALCQMIQSLRLGVTGYNPFIVIIVTAWQKSETLVSRVVNSGADDLVLRPFSTSVLAARIRTHIERRKGFVVTSEYVGPDRRRDHTRPSDIELFDPPNSLKMKALDRLSADDVTQRLDAELRTARERLNSDKLQRDSFQICVLWRLTQCDVPGTQRFETDLEKLKAITKSIARRCLGTDVESAIDWCESILAALEGLEAGVDRNASMHLLGHAALNLHQVFSPDKTQAEHLAEVDATVSKVKARFEAALAS